MIGFNGGLIGGFRDTTNGTASVPGVWTANEQVVARRREQWINGDPFFSSVSLLLPADGANGSTSIIDRSPSPKTITAGGNAQISTTQSKFGGSSLAFDGNTDYCLISSTSDLVLSANFTIDVWVYFNAFNAANMTVVQTAWDGSGGGFALWHHNSYSTKISVWMESFNSNVPALISSSILSVNTWYYASVQRSGNIFSLWLNGVKEDEKSAAISISKQISAIGAYQHVANPTWPNSMNGYIDDLRITKGVARYTANFTPPTGPHPLF